MTIRLSVRALSSARNEMREDLKNKGHGPERRSGQLLVKTSRRITGYLSLSHGANQSPTKASVTFAKFYKKNTMLYWVILQET